MFRRAPAIPAPDPTATPVLRRPPMEVTVNGLVFVFLILFMGAAAIQSQANLLFGVFGLMIGVLLISGTISRAVLRRLRVRRVLPEHAAVGRRTTFAYEFRNAKRHWPSLSIVISELAGSEAFTRQPSAYLLHVAPRATATMETSVVPKRRGLHVMDAFQISTGFPFGFVRRARERRHRDTLLVYPAVGRVDPALLRLCQAAQESGAMLRPRRGGADEFYGVREFRVGDNPRWIYWRRSARTGVLVAKEMTLVAPPRLFLLVDTCVAPGSPEQHALVEQCIAMAASLADHALESGLMVGLCAWSRHWITINPNLGKHHRQELMETLARLHLNTQHAAADLLSAGGNLLRGATTPVLITPRPMPAAPPVRGRSQLLVITPASPQSKQWFQFDETVDFSRCMPLDQQPPLNPEPRPLTPEP